MERGGQASLFGQADRRERAAVAAALVWRDVGAFGRGAQRGGARDRLMDAIARGLRDRHAHRDAILVVAHARLGDGLPDVLFEQQGIRDSLHLIAVPRARCALLVSPRPPALVLDGVPRPIAPPHCVEPPSQPERLRRDGHLDQFALLVEFFVQSPPLPDGLVGHAQLLDLLEVEQTLAIGQGVQGHDAKRRGVALDHDRVGRTHGVSPVTGVWEASIMPRVTGDRSAEGGTFRSALGASSPEGVTAKGFV